MHRSLALLIQLISSYHKITNRECFLDLANNFIAIVLINLIYHWFLLVAINKKFNHYEKQWNIFIVLQLHVKNCCNKSSMELIKFMSFHNNRFNLYRVSGLPLLQVLLWFSLVLKRIWLIIFDATLKFDAILMGIVFHCLSLCQYKCQN